MTKPRRLHSSKRQIQNPRRRGTYPLGMVLQACPPTSSITEPRAGSTTGAIWRRRRRWCVPALGVSPDAWARALEAMGEHDASIVIAAILQRGDEIKSAGGYLRVLTAKARAGEFSLGPVLMALLRGKGGESGAATQGGGVMGDDKTLASHFCWGPGTPSFLVRSSRVLIDDRVQQGSVTHLFLPSTTVLACSSSGSNASAGDRS